MLVDEGGQDAIDAAIRALGQLAVPVKSSEAGSEAQEQTVIEFAGSLPLIWITAEFSERAQSWAHQPGPDDAVWCPPAGFCPRTSAPGSDAS